MKKNHPLRQLFTLLLNVKTKNEMANLLDDLLTPQELISIAERWQILQALLKGESQRTIAKKLGTSIGKVSRGSRIIQFGKTNWQKKI